MTKKNVYVKKINNNNSKMHFCLLICICMDFSCFVVVFFIRCFLFGFGFNLFMICLFCLSKLEMQVSKVKYLNIEINPQKCKRYMTKKNCKKKRYGKKKCVCKKNSHCNYCNFFLYKIFETCISNLLTCNYH
jgi:hypothetical protein